MFGFLRSPNVEMVGVEKCVHTISLQRQAHAGNNCLSIYNNDDLLHHCSEKDKRISYRIETAIDSQQVSVSGH